MNNFWKILLIIFTIYYLYVIWVLLSGKNTKSKEIKKIKKNEGYLQINDNFVNESQNEQAIDLETILNQVDEVENNSALLEAFKKSSQRDDLNNSLTRKNDETFKVIRNKDSANKKDSDSET